MTREPVGPIPLPPPASCTLAPRPPPLDPASPEGQKYRDVLGHFGDESLSLPVKEGEKETRGLDEWEKMFCSEEMMMRYLKATKWNVQKAVTRLRDTLIWRRTLDLYNVQANAEELAVEFESGKIVITGYTRQALPILYTWSGRNEQPASPRQVKHMMFCMERVIDLQVAGVQGVMFCADVSGKTQTQSGAMGVARQILSNLQAHYPERLGGAAILNMPWLGSIFVSLMWPFVDPDTRKKIFINPDLSREMVAPDQLLAMFGGKLDFDYSPEYLDALVKLCIARRSANLARWREKGGRVGLSEWDFLEPLDVGPPATAQEGVVEYLEECSARDYPLDGPGR